MRTWPTTYPTERSSQFLPRNSVLAWPLRARPGQRRADPDAVRQYSPLDGRSPSEDRRDRRRTRLLRLSRHDDRSLGFARPSALRRAAGSQYRRERKTIPWCGFSAYFPIQRWLGREALKRKPPREGRLKFKEETPETGVASSPPYDRNCPGWNWFPKNMRPD